MLNSVQLIGRLGKDPEFKALTGDKKKCDFSVATSFKYGDTEYTDWHKVVVWGKLADIANSYLKKGSLIYVEGSNKSRSYETSAGEKRYITEVVCKNFRMLDSKSGARKEQASTEVSFNKEPTFEPADEIPF